jgi:hypothetical protein
VPRVQLHVPLQHDVEEHLAPLPSAAAGGESSCEATKAVLILNGLVLMLLPTSLPCDTRIIKP